jgi:hypothetical protein
MRNRIADTDAEAMEGKMLRPDDISVLLVGPTRVLRPDGEPLAVYLPGAIDPDLAAEVYPILHSLKGNYTSNRGYAAGTPNRAESNPEWRTTGGARKRSYAKKVDSAIIGAWEASGPKQFCRLTAWSGREVEAWRGLWPLFERIADNLAQHVPERYRAQMRAARKTSPDWVIPGTPFTTITVNNTYPTAVHTDKGDLESGFSTLCVFRRGEFKGGWLCIPQYRLAVDMQEGDLLLMDAHEWHGNTPFDPMPTYNELGTMVGDPGFERISVVSYFRTKMQDCGDAETEAERRRINTETRNAALIGE